MVNNTDSLKKQELGDDCTPNSHLGRLIIGFIVPNPFYGDLSHFTVFFFEPKAMLNKSLANGIGCPTVNRRINFRKYMAFSNQTLHYILKRIRFFVFIEERILFFWGLSKREPHWVTCKVNEFRRGYCKLC